MSAIYQADFTNSLVAWLYDAGVEEGALKIKSISNGSVISISEFMGDFELIFEPKGNYYRIDLRIKFHTR